MRTLRNLFLLLLCSVSCYASQLTGTIKKPDGTGFTGTLYLSIAQQVGVSSTGTCGGPVLLTPTQQISIAVNNGTMVSPPNVYGSDCTLPAGMPYNAILKDTNGNVMFSTQWLITGTTQDVGTVYQGPSQIPPTALILVPGVGIPTGACSIQTAYFQTDAVPGSNIWGCINGTYVQQGGTGVGTYPSATIIASSITGNTCKSVLLFSYLTGLATPNSAAAVNTTADPSTISGWNTGSLSLMTANLGTQFAVYMCNASSSTISYGAMGATIRQIF